MKVVCHSISKPEAMPIAQVNQKGARFPKTVHIKPGKNKIGILIVSCWIFV